MLGHLKEKGVGFMLEVGTMPCNTKKRVGFLLCRLTADKKWEKRVEI